MLFHATRQGAAVTHPRRRVLLARRDVVAPAAARIAPDLDVGVQVPGVEDRDVPRPIAYDELVPVRPPYELVVRRIFELVGRVGLASEKTPPYSRGRQTAYRRPPADGVLKASADGGTSSGTVGMSLRGASGEHATARFVRRPAVESHHKVEDPAGISLLEEENDGGEEDEDADQTCSGRPAPSVTPPAAHQAASKMREAVGPEGAVADPPPALAC